MTIDFAHAWAAVAESPLFGLTITVLAFLAAQRISRLARGNPLANPVLVSILLTAAVLLSTGVSYDQYMVGAQYIAFLLGPATVALAFPLYRESRKMARSAASILITVAFGSVASIIAAVLITRAAGGSEQLALSMAPKASTAPVAIALSQSIGGIPSLTAVFAIFAGILGAVTAPHLLSALRVRDERIRGLAMGVVSHGIGTSRMLQIEPAAGAFSALGMALNALATTVALPLVLLFLQ